MADVPDKATADFLTAAAIGLTLGTNLFRGPIRPSISSTGTSIPHEAVFCLTTGGPAPREFIQGNTGPDMKFANVQVRVRSNVGSFGSGQTLAATVWTTLQRAVFTDYMSVTLRESEPVYLGQDDTEHHEWTMNVETVREE